MYCLDGQPLLPSASPEKPVDPRRSVKKDAPVSTAVAKRSDGVLCYDHPNRRLRTLEAASYLGLSKSTLEKYRLTGEGPKFAKLGKTCTYSLADLDDWVEARTRTSTSEPR
ncbi:MAG: helix-turn-helix domain-containing protein [Magnetospirillum sp.]|nr:helix-turn-helix domain-containing protein [Magnetospirillum sp.]